MGLRATAPPAMIIQPRFGSTRVAGVHAFQGSGKYHDDRRGALVRVPAFETCGLTLLCAHLSLCGAPSPSFKVVEPPLVTLAACWVIALVSADPTDLVRGTIALFAGPKRCSSSPARRT